MPHKPIAYNSVSPYLVVRDVDATLAFLDAVFDAERLRRFARPDGSVMHAEVRIDDTVVMLGGDAESRPAMVHVYVPDVDATYHRALVAGGTSLQEPLEKGDGDRRGAVGDPNGIQWWISTEVGHTDT